MENTTFENIENKVIERDGYLDAYINKLALIIM